MTVGRDPPQHLAVAFEIGGLEMAAAGGSKERGVERARFLASGDQGNPPIGRPLRTAGQGEAPASFPALLRQLLDGVQCIVERVHHAGDVGARHAAQHPLLRRDPQDLAGAGHVDPHVALDEQERSPDAARRLEIPDQAPDLIGHPHGQPERVAVRCGDRDLERERIVGCPHRIHLLQERRLLCRCRTGVQGETDAGRGKAAAGDRERGHCCSASTIRIRDAAKAG